MYACLALVSYKPLNGNVRHVAFHLKVVRGDQVEHFIYQVVGEATNMTYGHREGTDPSTSVRYAGDVLITDTIDDEDTLSAIKKVLVDCPIDNDIVTSDCHDWCVKGLELMHDDDLIEDEGYYGASEYLLNLGRP